MNLKTGKCELKANFKKKKTDDVVFEDAMDDGSE